MALRKTSSSSLSKGSLTSFLSGYASQALAVKSAQEDQDWQSGQITDDEYLEALRARKANSQGLAAVNIGNRIDDLVVSTKRKQIQADIEAGKKSYPDLVSFETTLLQDMKPGSVSYNSQAERVDAANANLVSLARKQMKQAIQNRQASSRDLAEFEKESLAAFTPGSLAYNTQVYAVQDALRQADKDEYQKSAALKDAQFNVKLQEAKASKNVAMVNQLTNQHAEEVAQRIQDNPQYFTNADGSPDANYFNAQSRINSIITAAGNFGTQIAAEAASAGKKASAKLVGDQEKMISKMTADIDNQIKAIQSGNATDAAGNPVTLSGAASAQALADLTAQKLAINSSAQEFFSQMVAASTDPAESVQYQTKAVQLQTAAFELNQKATEYKQLAAGGSGVVQEYDPATNTYSPKALTSVDGSLNGYGKQGLAGYIKEPTGERNTITSGDGVITSPASNGGEDQYITKNGRVYYRNIANPQDYGSVEKTDFMILNDEKLMEAIKNDPRLLTRIGLPQQRVDEITANLRAEDPNFGVTVPVKTAAEVDENGMPVQQDLKVQNAPTDAKLSQTIQVGDLNVNNQKLATKVAEETQARLSVEEQNKSLGSNVEQLKVQRDSAASLAERLRNEAAAGSKNSAALAKQVADLQKQSSELQKTYEATKLQNTTLAQQLQDAIKGSTVQSTAPANTVQPAATGTPAVKRPDGTYVGS